MVLTYTALVVARKNTNTKVAFVEGTQQYDTSMLEVQTR